MTSWERQKDILEMMMTINQDLLSSVTDQLWKGQPPRMYTRVYNRVDGKRRKPRWCTKSCSPVYSKFSEARWNPEPKNQLLSPLHEHTVVNVLLS
ncbi:hypothetical protein F2P81_006017 [Scophthalmus maximus]|uniref:Uncharacterized protein n=1 Tax=Scophthalmus maximus TaxID=52904 RepID=A0A6A4TBA1_SCOMX|nr:hypothetical protein F2P81_006017 [Scophthalmus maximus]